MSPDQFKDIATLARLGLKVVANDDKMSPGQIAGAAQTLDAYIAHADAQINAMKLPQDKKED